MLLSTTRRRRRLRPSAAMAVIIMQPLPHIVMEPAAASKLCGFAAQASLVCYKIQPQKFHQADDTPRAVLSVVARETRNLMVLIERTPSKYCALDRRFRLVAPPCRRCGVRSRGLIKIDIN